MRLATEFTFLAQFASSTHVEARANNEYALDEASSTGLRIACTFALSSADIHVRHCFRTQALAKMHDDVDDQYGIRYSALGQLIPAGQSVNSLVNLGSVTAERQIRHRF